MRTKQEMLGNTSEVDFIARCRLDFKFFCQRLLNLTDFGGIHKYQMEWFFLIQGNDRIMIEAPSGFSKTTIVGVAYPLWLIFNFSSKKILLVSKTLPQAKDNMLGQIRDYIEDNEFMQCLVPKDADKVWNQSQLKTTNGCSITNRPYSVNIKSYRADVIICDEIDSYEDASIYFDYVVSRLNPGGKIIGISTPENEGRIIGLIKARRIEGYVLRKYVAIVNCKIKGDYKTGESIWAEKFPMKYLLSLQKEQGEQFFEKNYMCNVKIGSEASIYKLKHIMAGFDSTRNFTNKKEGGFIILGADFAISQGPMADFDAYVIIEKRDNFYIIKYIETWKGIPTPSKVTRIEELAQEYGVDLIIADESNIGKDAIDGLLTKGHYVISQTFSSPERRKLLVTLKNIIDSEKLIIPRDQENLQALDLTNKMVTQLLGFVEKESEKTKHKLLVSTALHDDIVMALAMAVSEGTKQSMGDFFEEEKPPKQGLFPNNKI